MTACGLEVGSRVTPTPMPIGGVIMSVNRLEILAPWLGLAALMVAMIAAVMVRRHRLDI